MTPDQYCESKVAQSGSNLTAAFKILPAPSRAAITALYVFCREVDDVVDECTEPQLAAIKLSWWKTELDRLFEGTPNHPVTKALLPVVPTYIGAGVSRSPTLVAAYLMHNRRIAAAQALQYLKERRPCVDPNAGFMQQLLAWEAELGI